MCLSDRFNFTCTYLCTRNLQNLIVCFCLFLVGDEGSEDSPHEKRIKIEDAYSNVHAYCSGTSFGFKRNNPSESDDTSVSNSTPLDEKERSLQKLITNSNGEERREHSELRAAISSGKDMFCAIFELFSFHFYFQTLSENKMPNNCCVIEKYSSVDDIRQLSIFNVRADHSLKFAFFVKTTDVSSVQYIT